MHSAECKFLNYQISKFPNFQIPLAFSANSAKCNSAAISTAGMLVHNYRSHSRLLELPSRLYYDNQLLASADAALVTAPTWSELQRTDRYPSALLGRPCAPNLHVLLSSSCESTC